MTEETALDFEGAVERDAEEPALVVDVEGFEGPLDLLLALARQQKVDLAKISILALADQYLAFIEHARKVRLELAADYLVMAAWLAYLKSRLLLPDAHPQEGRAQKNSPRHWRCACGGSKLSAAWRSSCSSVPSSIATCSPAAARNRLHTSSDRNGAPPFTI
jgi:hypothetical protein